MIKFCPMCGTKLNDKAKICRGCGLIIKAYETRLAKLYAVEFLNLGHKSREAKDYENALRYYLKAAVAGNTDAMYQVGEMYYYGMGVAADIAKAKEWYKKSGKQISNEPAANDSADVKPKPQKKSSPKTQSDTTHKETAIVTAPEHVRDESGKQISNEPAANDSADVKPKPQKKSSPKTQSDTTHKETAIVTAPEHVRDESGKQISNEPVANDSADVKPKPQKKSSPKTQSDTAHKETAIVTAQEPVRDENTFSILGYDYTFKPNFVTYNSVHKIFVANAYKKRKEFTAEYNERVHNFDEFYSVGIKIFEQKNF